MRVLGEFVVNQTPQMRGAGRREKRREKEGSHHSVGKRPRKPMCDRRLRRIRTFEEANRRRARKGK